MRIILQESEPRREALTWAKDISTWPKKSDRTNLDDLAVERKVPHIAFLQGSGEGPLSSQYDIKFVVSLQQLLFLLRTLGYEVK